MCFVDYYIFHFSLQLVFHLIHFLLVFLLSLLAVLFVSINWSGFVDYSFLNGFTLFFDDDPWFTFMMSHLDSWSSDDFTRQFYLFNSFWRKRIWFCKWHINLSEWFSGAFAILVCNSSFLKIITSYEKYFFRESI